MKLIYKFSLPSLIQAILILCLLVYIAITGNSLIKKLKTDTHFINQSSEQLNGLINQINLYFLETVTQPVFSSQVQKTIADIQSNRTIDFSGIVEKLKGIDASIKQADQLRQDAKSNIDQILDLTEKSIEQSNSFIAMTAKNLADPKKRDQVSTLERMVIQGANVNTTSSMKIQVLVYQMLKDYQKKSDLLAFINQSLENVEKDVKSLKDTPFAQMAIKAKEANLEVERLVDGYIDNIESIKNIETKIHRQSEEMLKMVADVHTQSLDYAFDEVMNLGILLAVSLIVLSLILISVGFLTTRVVTSPLMELKKLVTDVAETGDFSKQLVNNRKDEIGETVNAFNRLMKTLNESIADINLAMEAVNKGNFNHLVTREQKGDLERLQKSINGTIEILNNTIRQVVSASEQVSVGTSELSSSSQALANGTTEQAASIEEISSSMSEVGSRASANNDNANQTAQLSGQTMDVVTRGVKQMETMLMSMDKINETSSDISKIIKVIDEIAFQTNLLALNAAVEAARAGKYGKGFAVVAEEVRNLAARSAEAAKSTTEMIENSIKEVELGVNNASKTADVLNEINDGIKKVNDLAEEIAYASREQNENILEINNALTQVNSVIQQNSSIAEQTSSASQELNNHSQNLLKLMSQFQLNRAIAAGDNEQVIDNRIRLQREPDIPGQAPFKQSPQPGVNKRRIPW